MFYQFNAVSNNRIKQKQVLENVPQQCCLIKIIFHIRSAVHVRLGNFNQAIQDIDLALKERPTHFLLKTLFKIAG